MTAFRRSPANAMTGSGSSILRDGADEVVLVQVGVPARELGEWTRQLEGIAVIVPAGKLGGIAPARDTLVVTMWSGPGVDPFGDYKVPPDLKPLILSSTRVVGVFIDEERSTALAGGLRSHSPGLSWLREISDMVVVSSDSQVVAELVSTLADAAR